MMSDTSQVDLLIKDALLVATMDEHRREIQGGWVSINDGLISGVGTSSEPPPPANRTITATNCLVTPGFINTHHHMFQNLTRAFPPMTSAPLFEWLQTLYPLWSALDEEAAYLSAWIGLAELALGGCTTSTDHLYLHPAGAGDLITATITAANELGMRFHPTHGSMSLSEKDGGLPPDSVVRDDDEILAESERLVGLHHDNSHGAMTRIALAPCSPFSVTPELMTRTAELAERLDVRLHTHLAENDQDDEFSMDQFGRMPVDQFAEVGWLQDRSWVAHAVRLRDNDITRMAGAGVGVAHCPSSNMILSSGIAPVSKMRSAGMAVGLGCDGSSSADSASLWQEARTAMLLGKLSSGADSTNARHALEMATRGGARCLGREGEIGELSVGAAADVVLWQMDQLVFAGGIADPVETLMRGGPATAETTIVNGKPVVADGQLIHRDLASQMDRHRLAAARIQNTR